MKTIQHGELAARLQGIRLPLLAEKSLQAKIGQMLGDAGIAFEAEVRLSPHDRIDFLIENIGIEVKIKGAARDFLRQLTRYAAHQQVQSLILLTGRAVGMPSHINGKPLAIVSLGRAWL